MYVFNLKCIFTDTNYVMIIVYRYNIFTRVIIYNVKLIFRKKKNITILITNNVFKCNLKISSTNIFSIKNFSKFNAPIAMAPEADASIASPCLLRL